MTGDARAVAYAVVRRSLDGGAYADRALDGEATRAGLDARGRAFASYLALGTVQHLRTLDRALEQAADRSPDRLERPLLHALRLGAFQILFAGSVPDRAAVSETVELVRETV
ncbi:MAG TPA: transcription antitermination factor NusB, partial [Gaiellales bacterium]